MEPNPPHVDFFLLSSPSPIFFIFFLKERQLEPFFGLQAKGLRKASPEAKAHSVK